jgi:hypothetical protein
MESSKFAWKAIKKINKTEVTFAELIEGENKQKVRLDHID